MSAPPFAAWLDAFVEDNNLNVEHVFTVVGRNWETVTPVTLCAVLDVAKAASPRDQDHLHRLLAGSASRQGNPLHVFKHLAAGIARSGSLHVAP